jgi:hypothetical protein
VHGFRWERWSALAGVLFVALFAVALGLSGNTGDTPTEATNWYADDDNQTKTFVAWFLYIGSAIAFLSFLGTLRDMLVRAEGGPGTLSALVFGPGIAFTALYVASVSLFAAPAALADDSDFKVDPNTAEMFSNAGYLTLVSGVMLASIVVLSGLNGGPPDGRAACLAGMDWPCRGGHHALRRLLHSHPDLHGLGARGEPPDGHNSLESSREPAAAHDYRGGLNRTLMTSPSSTA